MLDYLVGFWVVMLIVGILGWSWRINMALNHPEKYERLRKLEEDTRENFSRAYKPFAPAAKKAGSVGARLLIRILTKRR